MPDYKAMYYHLAGRIAGAVETLDSTTDLHGAVNTALISLSQKLKTAQQATEDMFINSPEHDEEDEYEPDGKTEIKI